MKTKLLLLITFFGFGITFGQNENPAFSISDATATEGGSMVFTVALANTCNVATTILLGTINGTANNQDYNVIQTTVTIPAGQITTTVIVSTIQDSISEPSETFSLVGSITSGCNANTNLTNTVTGTINDNDPLPTVTISSATVLEGNPAIFTIALSNPSSVATIILINTETGTATNTDFTASQATVTIPAGAMSVSFGVPTSNDTISENNESFLLCGTVITSNTANTTSCGDGTIVSSPRLALTAIATYNDFNNDGYTNVGDVINYQYTITNTGQQDLYNISLSGNQSEVFGAIIPFLGVGAANTSYTGIYIINQNDINLGFVANEHFANAQNNTGIAITITTVIDTVLNISNGIKLNLFFDTNGNGVQNAGEQNYSGGNFTYQLNNVVIHNVNSQNGMFYLYESNPSNIFNLGCTLSANNNFCNGQYSLVTSSYASISVANGSGITTYNFPVVAAPCTDLSVKLYQYGAPPRPGFTYMNQIIYTNNGNQTIASGTVTFTRNATVSAVSTFPATTANASGFTYNFTNLLPNQTRYIDVIMQVPVIPTVSLGQLLTNSVSVSVPPNDFNAANNLDSLTQIIVGSFDPNDKTESHGNKILLSSFSANDYLTYKIQFENTGTFEAVNIRVNDVLDAKLNENTIRMVSASHPYVLDRVGANLNWKFDGVNLPPSVANTQIGHGFIIFQVKPKIGYSVGDIIPNIASIFFDFNPPIVTEPCITQFVSTLANTDFDTNSISVYPNPVQNKLIITNTSSIDSIEVISILGQTVLLQTTKSAIIDLSALEKGVYFVKAASEGKVKTIRIVKE